MIMKLKPMIFLVFTFLLCSFLPVFVLAEDSDTDRIEVEAAPEDVTIDPVGPMKEIDYIDEGIEGKADFITLFTEEFASEILVNRLWVAVQVNDNNEVLQVVNPSDDGSPPKWEEEQYLEVPEGGYVLLAHDDSWATKDFRKFLSTNFKVGDLIKLRKNGEVVPVSELMTGEGPRAGIHLDNQYMYTETEPTTAITGAVRRYEEGESYRLIANEHEIAIAEDGTFNYAYQLNQGTNYIDIAIYKNDSLQDEKSLVVYFKDTQFKDNEVFLWVEQGPNARRFQTSESIYDMLVEAKDAGITAIALDVKGVEGFASYQKNDLTDRPYVSEMTSPTRAGSNPDVDILEEFIKHAHSLDLTVHASFNVFAEGSIVHNEFAVLNDHLDWEEQIYRYEDDGEILRLRDSQYGKEGASVAFVNPANPDVREYQMKSIEEVIKNYDVDGVLLDRGRYDNYFADFSDLSRVQFEDYLVEKGKELNHWPEDIFTYNGSARVDGPLINEWYTYRSSVIKNFVGEIRELVDNYNEKEDRNVLLSSYVGSWYESYYLNGVNWASPNFDYNERLQFPQENLYTDEYYQTGYTDDLDFLMIGTYQSTANEVKKYITLGNIVTAGNIPLYAGMALANIQDPPAQREVFQAGLNNTNGLMLFDFSQANFPMIKAAIDDVEYVKEYQLGMNDPRDPDHFIEGDFLNINRNEGNINVYTEAFGLSTSTSTWGVEAVIDASGQVTNMVNKKQAMDWEWVNVETNNSVIPEGGFVISTEDPSGQRENRQLIANAYDVGDEVRASILRGFLDYDGQTFHSSSIDFEGDIQVLGPGEAEVTVNGSVIPLEENGHFSTNIDLQLGENIIEVVVHVDGYKTHHKLVEVIGEDQGSPPVSIDTIEELVKEVVTEPRGIRNSLLVQLNNAKRDFEKAERFFEQGKEKQANQLENNGYKKLENVKERIEQHSGKHIEEELANQLLVMLDEAITNRSLSPK